MSRDTFAGGVLRLKSIRVPIAAVSMTIVAGFNLSLVLTKFQQGGDPLGYANATILALLWAFAMLWESQDNGGTDDAE